MSFVHLKTYSEYSIIKGINRIEELTKKSLDFNMPAVALTDSNALFGAIDFYKEARKKGIKPIIGIDITVEQEDGNTYQLTLLAKNTAGYKQLTSLNSKAYIGNRRSEGSSLKEEWLEELGDTKNIIILSGAKEGLIGQKILADDIAGARQTADQMKSFFGEDFYIELQRDGTPQEDKYMEGAVGICQDLKIAPVATHPVLFQNQKDFLAHETRYCISNKYVLLDMDRPQLFNKEMYFKSADEMAELFSDIPEAINNTEKIAKKCSLELVLDKPQLPIFPTPNGEKADDYFSKVSHEGLNKRLSIIFPDENEREEKRKIYEERLNLEISTIKKMQFPGYFLIVYDFINWAKENGIPIGPGRGSGAGSLVAYSMGITDLDPIPYNLLFERFLNPERVSMPDFDIDMCKDRRGEIIDYVRSKYGENAVCQIGTFGTMAAKAVVRDVGRALDFPYNKVADIAKMINISPAKPLTLNEFIFGNEKKGVPPNDKMLARYDSESDVKKLVDIALTIEGLTKSIGTHASGVLISPTKLTDYTALFTLSADAKPVSQFNKNDVETAGLVKFDFLGLKELTIIEETVQNINGRHKNNFDITTIPLDREDVYKNIFANGNTVSIFQFESPGMRKTLKNAKPTRFEDITALNALYRPGPMEIIPDYIQSKETKPEQRVYPHPLLKNMLEETYGYMVYQEQVMECAKIIGGYSLGGADLLRRAMGKKKPEEMAEHREIFSKGAEAHNIPKHEADKLFDLMEKFAGYGFNKSHAAAYSFLAYQTAYLKYYYPEEYLAAKLNSEDDTNKIATQLLDCKNNNVIVLPVDINKSMEKFHIESERTLRYGMSSIKGVGDQAVKVIVQNREKHGPFLDFYDFLERVGKGNVNKRTVEALVKVGAFDNLNSNRAQLFDAIKEGLDYVTKYRKKQLSEINLLGDALENTENLKIVSKKTRKKAPVELIKPTLPKKDPWNEIEKANQEKSALGLYFTTNPYLNFYAKELGGFKTATVLAALESIYNEGERYTFIGGIIEEIKIWKSGKGAFVKISDGTSTVDMSVFDDSLTANKDWLKKDAFISARVKMEVQERIIAPTEYSDAEFKDEENGINQVKKEEEIRLSAQQVFSFDKTKELTLEKIFVGIENTEQDKKDFYDICGKFNESRTRQEEVNVILCTEENGRRSKREAAVNLSSNTRLLEDLTNRFNSTWVKAMFKTDIDNIRFPEVNRKSNYKQNNKPKKAAFVN